MLRFCVRALGLKKNTSGCSVEEPLCSIDDDASVLEEAQAIVSHCYHDNQLFSLSFIFFRSSSLSLFNLVIEK